MQDDTAVSLRCIVDISDLYKHHCSVYALNVVSEYLGGLNKLVEISCHFAILELNSHQIQYAQLISKYLDIILPTLGLAKMVENIVAGMVKVLKMNFILMLTRPHTLQYLNHIQVLSAVTHTPTTLYNDIPLETTLTMNTIVYWNARRDYGVC